MVSIDYKPTNHTQSPLSNSCRQPLTAVFSQTIVCTSGAPLDLDEPVAVFTQSGENTKFPDRTASKHPHTTTKHPLWNQLHIQHPNTTYHQPRHPALRYLFLSRPSLVQGLFSANFTRGIVACGPLSLRNNCTTSTNIQ